MKTLAEFIKEIKHGDDDACKGESWSVHIEKLKTFPEFKNVKKINVVSLPIYKTLAKTGEPLNLCQDRDFLGAETGVACVLEMKLDENSLNEEIDLYDLTLGPALYNPNGPKPEDYGVWASPLMYNPFNFEPKRKIEIIYSLDSIADIYGFDGTSQNKIKLAKEKAKQIILDKVGQLIDSGETNWPEYRSVIFRGSSRSFKKQKNENNE